MSLTSIRIFKAIFALTLAAIFAWFCVFWSKTFAGVQASLDEVTRSQPVVPLASLPEETQVGPPRELAPQPTDLEAKAVDHMFPTRIYGPYALSVRDGLNEMVIGTNLLAKGVDVGPASADGADKGLEGVLGAIPAQLPTFGYISSGFGVRHSPFTRRLVFHKGIDFAVQYGSEVYATADGIVTFAGWHNALGRMIAIDHGYGITTRYGHNSKLTVEVGDEVRRGDVIARAGSTGRSTGSHVHYEVWVNGRPIDPSQFMFDVPDRSPTDGDTAVAMNPYPRASKSHHLGFAVGGDGAPVEGREPPPYPKAMLLPLNFAIVGLFGFFASLLTVTVWPRRSVLGRESH